MPLVDHLGDDMTTNRKRRGRGNHIDGALFPAMVLHVRTGDCLLAGPGLGCACGVRDFDGNERDDLIQQVKARMGTDDGHE